MARLRELPLLYAAAVFPSPSSCFALRRAKRVRASIHLLRNWLAEAKSKMPFDECSAAMGFQIGFKSVGFFSVFECYCVFDAPRFVFGCVRNITFIVFFKAGFQVFGTADIEMRSGCFIYENINVMKVGHKRKSFRITFVVMRCRVARLHLLPQITPRQSSTPCSLGCANGLPRRNLGFAEMKTGGRSRTRIYDLHDVNVAL